MIKVIKNGIERKREFLKADEDYHVLLSEVLKNFDIRGYIVGVSHDGGTNYGVYCKGKPTTSPVDLTGVRTDPLANDLIAFKLNLASKSIRAKVYYIGNVNNVEFDKPIAGTGVYVGEDIFTVYYSNDGISNKNIQDTLANNGFLATTFYADGTRSDESVYGKHIHKESKCH